MIDRTRARRAALAAQLAQAQQQYAELEQTLAMLDRQMCAMHGGLQELDALLAEPPIEAPPEETAAPTLAVQAADAAVLALALLVIVAMALLTPTLR